jgi:adenine phosphoribosyltransferase
MMLERLKRSLQESPVVKKGDYDYFVNPITDGVPPMDPAVLSEVVERMLKVGRFECDVILAPEAMGIPLAVSLSLRTGIPYCVVRKRGYGLPGEKMIDQRTGYSRSEMSINGLKAGDRVVIVDDVVSTGGTLKALVLALKEISVEIIDIVIVVEKGEGKADLEKEIGMAIKALVKVEMRHGHVHIVT